MSVSVAMRSCVGAAWPLGVVFGGCGQGRQPPAARQRTCSVGRRSARDPRHPSPRPPAQFPPPAAPGAHMLARVPGNFLKSLGNGSGAGAPSRWDPLAESENGSQAGGKRPGARPLCHAACGSPDRAPETWAIAERWATSDPKGVRPAPSEGVRRLGAPLDHHRFHWSGCIYSDKAWWYWHLFHLPVLDWNPATIRIDYRHYHNGLPSLFQFVGRPAQSGKRIVSNPLPLGS